MTKAKHPEAFVIVQHHWCDPQCKHSIYGPMMERWYATIMLEHHRTVNHCPGCGRWLGKDETGRPLVGPPSWRPDEEKAAKKEGSCTPYSEWFGGNVWGKAYPGRNINRRTIYWTRRLCADGA